MGGFLLGLASVGELSPVAGLMAQSPLLARYRVEYGAALASLEDAHAAGDTLLVARARAADEGDASSQRAGAAIEIIAGFAWLSLAPRILGGAAYLRLLLVAEAYQGTGLGSRLLEWVERTARERGARHLYLLATTDNHRARQFYDRHGYRHVGDLPGLVWPDLDEALYHKPLLP
jgi:GNAT superfamily N-acetyltransferase